MNDPTPSLVRERLQGVGILIDEILKLSGTPGLSFAVVHHGELVCMEHYGYRDVEACLKSDGNTRYNINSMSKAIFAALAGILVEEGLLNWDTRVKEVLPSFKSRSNIVENQATILDLLSHRTGITDFDTIWTGTQNNILLERDQALLTFASFESCGPFRNSFVYNNWGYEIAGQMMENVSNQSLATLLQEKIFKPLGIHRTSTAWETNEDDNVAKSYGVLEDLSPVEIHAPRIGPGTLMEAAGSIKSCLNDSIILYKTFLRAAISQFESGQDHTPDNIFKYCRTLMSGHTQLPGKPIREQTYGLGWARAQLPGQLGRNSFNAAIGEEPIVGKGSESRLDVYHHGCMPGSMSCVHLFLESETVVIVYQNSLAPIDTADFVGQLLVERIFNMEDKNDYVSLAIQFRNMTLNIIKNIEEKLQRERQLGTSCRPLEDYCGRYWNAIHNFCIDVFKEDDGLSFRLQDIKSETYTMQHHQNNSFSWLMSYQEIVERGRGPIGYDAQFYILTFETGRDGAIGSLKWGWDMSFPGRKEVFTKEARLAATKKGSLLQSLWSYVSG